MYLPVFLHVLFFINVFELKLYIKCNEKYDVHRKMFWVWYNYFRFPQKGTLSDVTKKSLSFLLIYFKLDTSISLMGALTYVDWYYLVPYTDLGVRGVFQRWFKQWPNCHGTGGNPIP